MNTVQIESSTKGMRSLKLLIDSIRSLKKRQTDKDKLNKKHYFAVHQAASHMKKRTIALIAILAALLTACTGKTDYNTTLVQADSLMASRPDSALHMLQGISTKNLSTKADRAYHALLLTQARDKNYIRQTMIR